MTIENTDSQLDMEAPTANRAQSGTLNDSTDSADAREMQREILESSTTSWMAKNTAFILDYMIVGATLFLSWYAFVRGMPEINKEIVYLSLGSLITMCGNIIQFHRGSSAGSAAKTEMLKNRAV